MSPERLFFLLRNPLAGLPLALMIGAVVAGAVPTLSAWMIGGTVVMAGILLRAWSVCHNHYGQGRIKRLATRGPYALNRNPLYLGSALIIAGVVFPFVGSWVAIASFGWSLLIYDFVARLEDVRLQRRYGERYVTYVAAVPKWIPRSLPSGDLGAPVRVFIRAVLAESVALLLFAPAMAMVLW